MSLTDQKMLKESQYKTSQNLRARINLHKNHGTNPYPWHQWVFEHLDIIAGMRILELGCGPADLWVENLAKTPADVSVTLADLSIGMLKEAGARFAANPQFGFLNCDAQRIPFPDEVFDVVVANHMLYHVPDIDLAIREIERVLAPGGILCAATNGNTHLLEIHDLIARFFPDFKLPNVGLKRFGLENGAEQLARHFTSVQMDVFPSDLHVTRASDLIDYIRSMWSMIDVAGEADFDQMQAFVQERIQEQGYFFIGKSQGLFIARSV